MKDSKYWHELYVPGNSEPVLHFLPTGKFFNKETQAEEAEAHQFVWAKGFYDTTWHEGESRQVTPKLPPLRKTQNITI